jgi:sirohydrochlorin ferrochelatase
MSAPEDNLDILQNLEFAVVGVWRRHPEMTDHVALRAYEAAHEQYRAEARGHAPKPCALTGLDRETFDALSAMCEFRLGRRALPGGSDEPVPPIPVSRLLDCLRELRKSVERHTNLGGRQGYLTFIDHFLP